MSASAAAAAAINVLTWLCFAHLSDFDSRDPGSQAFEDEKGDIRAEECIRVGAVGLESAGQAVGFALSIRGDREDVADAWLSRQR